MLLSAFADGSSSGGTSRATTAPRVGMLIAKNAWLTASRASTSHTEPKFRNACSQSSADVIATPTFVTNRSFRRSTASAMAPPQSPKTSSGTSATSPERPTYADEPVRSKTCLGTATAVSWVPTAVTTVDSQSRMEGRDLQRPGVDDDATEKPADARAGRQGPPLITHNQ